jgi:hypothetical protein
MISGVTKNGVKLYVTFVEDVFPNECGYYCEIYLDDSCCNEVDNFVIHPFELVDGKTPEDVAKTYIENEFDDMPILCKEFNKAYDTISDAFDLINEFYINHIFFNKRCNPDHREAMAELFDKLGNVKNIAHEIAEHYTWDDE